MQNLTFTMSRDEAHTLFQALYSSYFKHGHKGDECDFALLRRKCAKQYNDGTGFEYPETYTYSETYP